MLGEIHDRVTDDLSRSMVSDVAAAVCGAEFDAYLLEQMMARSQMLALSVSPKRDHVRMLAEKQHVRDGARFARFEHPTLEFASRTVGR
jgi:hypothetical protein